MAVADANAAYLGLSTAKLMENAGAGVARKTVEGIESDNLDVLILSGRGNNGGDAMVAARFLNNIEGVDAELLLMGRSERITTEITADNYRVLENSMIDVAEVRDSTGLEDRNFGEYEVLVDGMLGTGVKGGLREPVASATEKTNAARDEGSVKVVSIDVPTGLDPDRTQVEVGDQDCVNPDLVVTFHDYKPIHQA
ncbi:MAG: NAD(P)H-hydrate epimerase, partial [Halobacteria archaeon]